MSVIQLRPFEPAGAAQEPRVDLWLSASELAAAALRGLPRTKRRVNDLARRERWASRVGADGRDLARTRTAQGGGIEYHVDLLPPAARAQLLKARGLECAQPLPDAANDALPQAWSWFDQQSEKVKAAAMDRLAIVEAISAARAGGMSRDAAVASAAASHGVSVSAIGSWLQAVAGVPVNDWLPHLAPRWRGGGRAMEVDADLFRFYVSLYATNNKRTHAQCYRMTADKAREEGLDLPHAKTLKRKLERDIDPLVIKRAREGARAFDETMPAQVRSVAGLHALRLVNIDGHQWDTRVNWPGIDKPVRPMMVAIQDIYSKMILAWRVDLSENVAVTRLVFYDLFRDWGIPEGCLLDNSRTFASKKLTEGARTRFRGKIRDEAPHGILPALNVNPHWALPYHGQSKPIERAFRDLCSDIARGAIEFEGCWTGNNTANKPANYGSKSVDLDVFLAVVKRGIDEHNSRLGRRTEMAKGKKSFAQVFAESYAVAPITKATPEQLRIAMLSTEHGVTARAKDGLIRLFGNSYWCDESPYWAKSKVTVRFDPDNLHNEIHVYDGAGKYLASAQCLEAVGFLDEEAARRLAKRRAEWRKKYKAATEAEQLMTVEEMKAFQAVRDAEDFAPEAKVIRPARRVRGSAATALKPVSEAHETPLSAPSRTTGLDRLLAAKAKLHLVE